MKCVNIMRYNQMALNRGGKRGKATYSDRIKVFKKATFSENNTKYGLVNDHSVSEIQYEFEPPVPLPGFVEIMVIYCPLQCLKFCFSPCSFRYYDGKSYNKLLISCVSALFVPSCCNIGLLR